MTNGVDSTKPKRVAFLVNHYPMVSHTFIRNEILGLERLGLQVERLSIRPTPSELVDASDIEEELKTEKILGPGAARRLMVNTLATMASHPIKFSHGVMAAWRLSRKSQRGFLYHLIYLAEACYLRCWSSRRQVRHIHVHFGTNGATVALLCKKIGGPTFSMTVHGPSEFDEPDQIALGDKVAEASFVVAITSFCASQLMRWSNPADWDRIHIVHCSVDDQFFLETNPIDQSANTLVCVGRLGAQKGHHILLDAFAKARDQGADLKLILIGDGELRGSLESRIDSLGIRDHVTLTGWKAGHEIKDYLIASRGFVMASFAEGLPVVIMEAMALGRPVITTMIAGIPELVKTNKTGWLVPAGSRDKLSQAMVDCAAMNVDALNEMGDQCRVAAREHHHGPTEAQKISDLFKAYL